MTVPLKKLQACGCVILATKHHPFSTDRDCVKWVILEPCSLYSNKMPQKGVKSSLFFHAPGTTWSIEDVEPPAAAVAFDPARDELSSSSPSGVLVKRNSE